ncbi:ATP-binding protein [Miniphocaeibacter massiliensis]|uniref:ATP-binding protein n=1 Tax=Miniphocaeibacter massiliensis TaxID=2041841 RepID=UPI000C087344|nr:ATP-binding protein [Miniphocaeibacter massiliensis]
MNDYLYADKIIENTRLENKKKLDSRKKEIELKIPEYNIFTNKIKLLNLDLIKNIKSNNEANELKIKNEIEELKKKREDLLLKNNYDKNYLSLEYNCEICKDIGEVNGKICKCKKDIINKIRLKRAKMYQAIDRETFENFNFSLFRDTKKEDEIISPKELMKLYFEEFKEYAKNFSVNSKSLYISGDVGVGKTYICNSISSEIIKNGKNVVYMTSSNLMQQLRLNLYSPFDKIEENQEKYNLLMESDLLIIDDLGSENITDTSVSNLFNLINNRMILRKPIIISTNIPIDEISKVYDERIASRIKTFNHHAIIGDDLRNK